MSKNEEVKSSPDSPETNPDINEMNQKLEELSDVKLIEKESTPESDLEALKKLQESLVDNAKTALAAPDFETRNSLMAQAVGEESSFLAAKSIDNPEAADKLKVIFAQACQESGEKFSVAFNESGEKNPDKEKEYKSAMNAAGEVALSHLSEALKVAGIDIDVKALLREATFDDVLKVVAKELKQAAPEGLTADKVRESLHKTAKGDYFEDQIDSLPFSEGGKELSDEEEQSLDMSVRLANATWKAGQVHRAKWETGDKFEGSRIDPNKREAFNPFDLLKQEQYKKYEEQYGAEEALIRVGLEVYKDVIQYKPLVEEGQK